MTNGRADVLDVVVIGIGNRYRRDDGAGPAVVAACRRRELPGVRTVPELTDPTTLLDVWSGAALVVLVDAAVSGSVPPGTVRCHRVTDLAEVATFGSHGMDVATVIRLGQALGRAPGEIVIVSVEAGDTGQGSGMTPDVAAAVPAAVELVSRLTAAVTERPAPIPVPRTRPR